MSHRRTAYIDAFWRWIASACLMLVPMQALAQQGASASGHARAEVLQPLEVVPRADLSFGSISVANGQAGTVRVPADGRALLYSSAVSPTCSGQSKCAAHRASFEVAGDANRSYRIAIPATVTARGLATGAQLIVGGLETWSLNTPGAVTGGRLDENGHDLFFVGGTLQIPVQTRSDLFRAEIPITIAYH